MKWQEWWRRWNRGGVGQHRGSKGNIDGHGLDDGCRHGDERRG